MNYRAQRNASECRNASERKIVRNIENLGWSLMGVLDEPPYLYTVGLEHSFEHPELIVLGMPTTLAAGLLNELGNKIAQGWHFREGDFCPGEAVHCSCPLLFGEVSQEAQSDYLLYAHWFYHGNDFRTLQVLWPDRHNRFPGDPCFSEELVEQQPLLNIVWA